MIYRTALPLIFLVLYLGISGCAVSGWVIPLMPDDRPSRIWSDDPRTSGWNGVIAEYSLMGDDRSVHAVVRSSDGQHRFKAKGRWWYENERGERITFASEDDILTVCFGEREERYLGGNYTSMYGRQLILVGPGASTQSTTRTIEGLKNTDIWLIPERYRRQRE